MAEQNHLCIDLQHSLSCRCPWKWVRIFLVCALIARQNHFSSKTRMVIVTDPHWEITLETYGANQFTNKFCQLLALGKKTCMTVLASMGSSAGGFMATIFDFEGFLTDNLSLICYLNQQLLKVWPLLLQLTPQAACNCLLCIYPVVNTSSDFFIDPCW